mmetsp:Transcript_70428/g.147448  ORF Transcript_70428/g.147448 Transcript_70428/m.147448 type:complete len:579 (+) Transcript_70428:1314-3050(+)
MDQVTESDARLHLALESDQDRLRHVQGHDSRCCCESNCARACREGDSQWEPGVRIATGADGVRQQHAVQPGVDDAITRSESDATTVHDEGGEGVVGHDIDRLRVGCSVAERLHHQVGGEAQAGQVLQLISGHGASGVLTADGGHLGLDVHARDDTRETSGLGHHLLGQGVARSIRRDLRSGAELVRRRHAEHLASPGSDLLADDQGHSAASLNAIQQNLALQLESRQDLVAVVGRDLALIRVDIDDVTHLQACDVVGDDGQGASILHGVEEDGSDGATDADAAELLVGDAGVLVAHQPEDGVGGGLSGGASADDIADIGEREALLLELLDLLLAVVDAITLVLQHGQGVERDVGSGEGILGRGQVIGVGLASDLEDAEGVLLRHLGLGSEPLGLSPALDNILSMLVALLHLLLNIELGVEHQDGVFELFSSDRSEGRVVESLDQGGDVVASDHLAKHLHGILLADEGGSGLALHDGGQEASLHVGGIVDSRRHSGLQQLQGKVLVLVVGVLQDFDHLLGPLCAQDLRRDAKLSTLCDMSVILCPKGRGKEPELFQRQRAAFGHLGRCLSGDHFAQHCR